MRRAAAARRTKPSARDGGLADGWAWLLCRGQDVGDGVWPVVSALLPRAAQLQVRREWARLAAARDSVARLQACALQC